MVRQPRWDQYEAALLLDYCVGVEEKKISKVDAVEAVSELLRARARAKGIQIDDTFRNINGITMQLASMRNCCLGRENGLTISKLFKEVVCMYKNDRERFDEILQEEGFSLKDAEVTDYEASKNFIKHLKGRLKSNWSGL